MHRRVARIGPVLLTATILVCGSVASGRTAEGTVEFRTRNLAVGLDAPVYEIDGTTPLDGAAFVGQLYGGAEGVAPAALGPVLEFRRGYLVGGKVEVPGVPEGGIAVLQVRAWESADGPTFEVARDAGGWTGVSPWIQVVTGGDTLVPPVVPAPLTGLAGFRLEGPPRPRITEQPRSITAVTGQLATFQVVAVGEGPLTFQWRLNGVDLPGAVGPTLVITGVSLTDAGQYSVMVRSAQGAAVSLPATLLVQPAPPVGGTLFFTNRRVADGLAAPVYDADGVTRLEGPGFVAQLYVGEEAAEMAPAGDPEPFLTGADAGFWEGDEGTARVLEGFLPGRRVFAQIRVWETAKGVSYADALAAGGRVGYSQVFEIETGGAGEPPSPPAVLIGLTSFRVGTRPVIVEAPAGGVVTEGQRVVFRVVASGTAPLAYQWRRNGVDLPGALTDELLLPLAQMADAGLYSVRVSNFVASAVSEEVRLQVREAPSGGQILFGNRVPAVGLDAPCFDTDGVTPLAGSRFTAILYAGPTPEDLRVAGTARFRTGPDAGYFGPSALTLATVGPQQTAYVRVEIAGGGASASSALFTVTAGGGGAAPTPLVGLPPLRLIGPPVILFTPDDRLVQEGLPVELTVTVAPNVGLTFQWQALDVDGGWLDVPGAESPTLEAFSTTVGTAVYRLQVANAVGGIVSDPIAVTFLPVVRLGTAEPRKFQLHLRAGVGSTCLLESSTNLVDWRQVAAVEVIGPLLELHESEALKESDSARFYRARDPGEGGVVSDNIAGFVPIRFPPGFTFFTPPLVLADDTVGAVLGDLPEGTLLYQYYPAPIGFTLNARTLGPWDDPTERLEPGRGAMVLTPGDAIYVLTLAGDVPQGARANPMTTGWNLRGSILPRGGQLDTDLGCPLERGDIVVRYDAEAGLVAHIYTEFGWLTDPATVKAGEAFWIWKQAEGAWMQSYP